MTYICPFCYHQQKERTKCSLCSFDLKSNHLNPFCSKCEKKFASMEALKVHFKECGTVYGKCQTCGMNFYSKEMFQFHIKEIHEGKESSMNKNVTEKNSSTNADGKCALCDSVRQFQLCKKCGYKDKSSTCPRCQSRFSGLATLKLHCAETCKGTSKEQWTCKHCLEFFPEYGKFQEHKRSKNCQDDLYRCPKCKVKFANKTNKQKHVMQNACGKERYAKCYFDNCNVRCLRRVNLTQHIKESHGVELTYEIKKFPTFNDFELWKDELGMETFTFYTIMARGKYTSNNQLIEFITYGCSFDFQRSICLKHKLGNQKDRKRKLRFDFSGSNICPSRINAKMLPDGQVIVRVCKAHSHDLSVERIKVHRLPKSRRDFLMNAFIMGAGVEDVMEVIAKESEDLNLVTKESTLPRRFFKEVQRKSLLKYSATNDMEAVSQFVEYLKLDNSILLYKNKSETFGNTAELEPDTFVLGWQTPLMHKILESYGHIIYVEGLYTPLNYPSYRLYNFLVTDEQHTVFPVAHFITNKTSSDQLILIFSSLRWVTLDLLVVQRDDSLVTAISTLFSNAKLVMQEWDLSSIDNIPKMRRNEAEEVAVVVLENIEDEEEQLRVISEEPLSSVNQCVLQFHKELKAQFRRSHRIFILLNVLRTYFKKKYSAKFDMVPTDPATCNEQLSWSDSLPAILSEMRKSLLQYSVEEVVNADEHIQELFQDVDVEEIFSNGGYDDDIQCEDKEEESGDKDEEEEEEEDDGGGDDDGTLESVVKDEIESIVDYTESIIDTTESIIGYSESILENAESIDESVKDDRESVLDDKESILGVTESVITKTESVLDHSDTDSDPDDVDMEDRDILKEIIVANAEEDESSIHLLQEYQESMLRLLKSNDVARPLIIKSVLEETKALYEQVRACCNETKNLFTPK